MLTDQPYFQGHDEYLKAVRAAVHLPLLRKDFILDPYQVIESRELGADCVLLIVAALSDEQIKELNTTALQLGMDILFEVHNKEEIDRILPLKPTMIGINNRNLKNLKVDLTTGEALVRYLPKNTLAVCESGINTTDDLARMKKNGFDCFLIGEALMREQDVKTATERFLGAQHG